MTRWWWGPVLASMLRIVINIPAYRLDAFVGDSLAATYPVAIGMPRYPTPQGMYTITSVEWNPWWIPPASDWAAREKATPPGPANPMGRVKLNFWPLYYVHGSPADASIGSAASHGCVRMHNADAIALARLVLHYGMPDLSTADIDRMARGTTTRRIVLVEPIPIELRYDLTELRDDQLYFYPDVYRQRTAFSPSTHSTTASEASATTPSSRNDSGCVANTP